MQIKDFCKTYNFLILLLLLFSISGVQFHGSMDQSDDVLKPIKKDIFHLNQDELKLENMKVYLDPNSNRKRKAGMLKYHMSRSVQLYIIIFCKKVLGS